MKMTVWQKEKVDSDPLIDAPIAQWIEYLIPIQKVAGSIPVGCAMTVMGVN